jgi:hypothetical protein
MTGVTLPPKEMDNPKKRGKMLKDYVNNLRKMIFMYGAR